MTDLRALTLIRPMPAAIVHGSKRIENRPQDLPKAMRGVETVVAVHAGKGWDDTYARIIDMIDGPRGGVHERPTTHYADRLHDEGIVGLMLLSGRVYTHVQELPTFAEGTDWHLRPWFSGPYGYEIKAAIAFPEPIPCRGMLGFWRVPADVVAQMRAQVARYGVDRELEELFYRGVGELWPCLECGSQELCEPECRVAPWNMEKS